MNITTRSYRTNLTALQSLRSFHLLRLVHKEYDRVARLTHSVTHSLRPFVPLIRLTHGRKELSEREE